MYYLEDSIFRIVPQIGVSKPSPSTSAKTAHASAVVGWDAVEDDMVDVYFFPFTNGWAHCQDQKLLFSSTTPIAILFARTSLVATSVRSLRSTSLARPHRRPSATQRIIRFGVPGGGLYGLGGGGAGF